MKRALITGITGQDGSYLAEFLLQKGYEVHGIIRRSSSFNTGRIMHLFEEVQKPDARLHLHYGDLVDASNLNHLLKTIQPAEIYNLAAQSHVKVSFDIPEYTADVVAIGALRLLDAIRETNIETKFYQASSSEMYGKVLEIPQNEQTPFHPRSPYAVAKHFAYWITRNYRESYGFFASNGILFNHESERRGETFVTRKITRCLAAIYHGHLETLYLGNLNAKRDWGHAADYVRGMWMMLQASEPDDFVLATGTAHSVREFVEAAAMHLDMNIVWQGIGLDEVGIDTKSNRTIIRIDSRYFRPAEVDFLLGDATKAKKILGWQPTINFSSLVQRMMEHDLRTYHHPK